MSSKFGKVRNYLRYYLSAKGKYKIQSPLAFEICQTLLEDRKKYYIFNELEALRETLKNDTSVVPVLDLGAGSVNSGGGAERVVGDIAKSALSPPFKCEWLFKLVLIFKPEGIIELGTCLGLSSLYMAMASKEPVLHTIEGSPSLHEIAKSNFQKFNAGNIKAYLGNFDVIFPGLLNRNIEMVYVDGNHTKEATLRYYEMIRQANSEKMVIIFDDIYWSKGMTEAWEEIKKAAPYSIDLYHLGIVIFDERVVRKQNFTIIPFRYKPWQIGLFN